MKIKRLANFTAASLLMVSSLLTFSLPLVHAVAQNCTWTGSGVDTKFSTVANWSNCGGAAPLNGDNLVFPTGASNYSPNNDLTSASFNTITFSGVQTTIDFYDISGNTIILTGGVSNVGTTSNGYTTDALLNVPLTINSNISVVISDLQALVFFNMPISGSGNITESGNGGLLLNGDNAGYTGTVTVNSATLFASSPNAIGTGSAPGAIINSGADFVMVSCIPFDLNGNLTLNGNSSITTGDFPNPKFGNTSSACNSSGGSGVVEDYGVANDPAGTSAFNGRITLGSDITFAGTLDKTIIKGQLSGQFKITMLPGYVGKLDVQSTNNTSLLPNGVYTSPLFQKTLSDSQPSTYVNIYGNNLITIDGARNSVFVDDGGILKGTGTLSILDVGSKGTVAPGHSPGCMTVNALSLAGTFQAEIGGTDPCTGYDQIKVLSGGTLDVSNGTLDVILYNGFAPKVGQSYTVIDNQNPAASAITGTFTGLAEGSTVAKNGVTYSVTYKGGDGNDAVLTVTKVDASALPAKPNTGFMLASARPSVILAITTLAAASLIFASRKLRTNTK